MHNFDDIDIQFASASSHLCPSPDHASRHKQDQLKDCRSNGTSNKIIVVGALSFLGSRFVSRLLSLPNNVNDVIAVAQDGDITASNNLLWYRKDQLLEHHGVVVKFANFSNVTQLRQTVLGADGKKVYNPSVLVYIAPDVAAEEEEYYGGEGVNINSIKSAFLKEFVMMLEFLRQTSPCTKVVLVTESSHDNHMISYNGHMTIKQAWMRTFEGIGEVSC